MAWLFEGEGQLCDVVPGTSTADSEPQASLSAPAWGDVSSSFLAGEMGRGLYNLWAGSAWRAISPARREEAEKLPCDTLSRGQCRPWGEEKQHFTEG